MLGRPAVDDEFLPLVAYGGVPSGSSSDIPPPSEPIVEARPRRPSRFGLTAFGEERADSMDLVESFRMSTPAADEDKFMLEAVRATCDGEGMGDGLDALSGWWMAVSGGDSAPGECWIELVLIALVEARGVAGAVSGNCGGVTFMGRGNKDGRCFWRPNLKRLELSFGVWRGLGVFSNETWPVELPSDRDESDWRGTGRDNVEASWPS